MSFLPNKRRTKRLLNDDQKRWIKNNHKILSVEQMAEVLGITTEQTMGQCHKLYCSYFSRKGAA